MKANKALIGFGVVGLVIVVGVLKQTGLMDGDTANTAVSLALGLVAGGAGATVAKKP